MQNRSCLTILASSFLVAIAPPQTLIVDAANGPGTSFTQLPTATVQAPDGAVLLVRPGTYSPFTLANKSLTILCDPGVSLAGTVTLGPTQPHQTLNVRGLTWSTALLATGTILLDLQSCAGPVLLEEIVQPANVNCLPSSPFGQCYRSFGIAALDCAQLAVRDCTIACTATFERCNVAVENCRITGEHHLVPLVGGRTALTVRDSTLQLAGNSFVAGGDGVNNGGRAYAGAGNGIFAWTSDLRLAGGTVRGGGNTAGPFPAPFGGFTVIESAPTRPTRIDPRVALTGFYGPQAGTDAMPMLTGSGAPTGGTLSSRVTTRDGDLTILVVGLPGPPAPLLGIADAFWLEPSAHVFVAIGVHQAANPIAGSIQVPNDPGLRALRLHWQAVCQGPNTGFQATNPVVTLVR
ncbi:MAG: hypothetical protein NXI31_25605 [bacterium]|nr:hypothetical protein [bacterium]